MIPTETTRQSVIVKHAVAPLLESVQNVGEWRQRVGGEGQESSAHSRSSACLERCEDHLREATGGLLQPEISSSLRGVGASPGCLVEALLEYTGQYRGGDSSEPMFQQDDLGLYADGVIASDLWFKLEDLLYSVNSTIENEGAREANSAVAVDEQPLALSGISAVLSVDPHSAAVNGERTQAPRGKPGGYTAMELRDEAKVADAPVSPTKFTRIREVAQVAGPPQGTAGQHSKYSNAAIRKLAQAAREGGLYRERPTTFRDGNAIAGAWLGLIGQEIDSQ